MGFTPPSKVMPLSEAISTFVQPGDTILAAYSDARPNAALVQLVRSFAGTDPQFRLVSAGVVSVQHALFELGLVTHVAASFIGENFPLARPSRAFQRAVAAGTVEVENWSMWSLLARLVAGALGIGMMPVHSLVGSDIAAGLPPELFTTLPNPFGGGTMGAVAPLNPDVVLLHGVAADEHGNVILSAPYGESYWGALAAKRGVVVTVEKIVDSAEIRRHSALVKVPAHVVRSVSPVPYGSHPYGIFNPGIDGIADYAEDAAFMADVRSATRDADTFRAWIDEWILGTADHDAYLAKLGTQRLSTLGQAHDLPGLREATESTAATTMTEYQVVAASRRIAERSRERGFDVLLAGVGLANLASWSAVADLADEGQKVELMAEIGMFGYDPQPGEPFIFSHQNLPTCTMMTDVAGVLGALVGGPASNCIGVLGAGEVDQFGNTNSTLTADGLFLVGSGGANDVASGAEEVLLTVDHRRLVKQVAYITCPGTKVCSIVSSHGVFERRGDEWMLVRYLDRDAVSAEHAIATMRALSDWAFSVSPQVSVEPQPTRKELARLRGYDPERLFLADR